MWNPHLKGEAEALEKVQKYALKGSWDVGYDDLLRETSLPLLQVRIQAFLCHLFKIVNELISQKHQ